MADGILGEIVAAKRAELAQRFAGVSLDALRGRAEPTTRSLAAAIARPGARFILEIKKASPSQGAIRAGADPAALARGYAGVADALSVLTDGAFFGGSLADLAAARAEFDWPILAKDFFVDPRQVAEARIAGADAVLVMLSVLNDAAAREMIAEARRFGMDALVEVHHEPEMRRALSLGAPLIGINNRDLRDLSIDLATTERLARLAPDRLLVSESGIATRTHVERLAGKVDGFLVGSALMRADDPAEAARALVFGRVKLCGLTRAEDIAAAMPAAFAGLVFVPRTPRAVTVEQARALIGKGPKPVGIFRNAPAAEVAETAAHLSLHAVQLHGQEDRDYVAGLRQLLPVGCEIWGAVSVGRDPLHRHGVDRLLFDNGNGGSGQSFDWGAVATHPNLPRALIAGGIGTANAASAMALGPYAIDVGSAVDSSPGVKSPTKIAALFDALRPAARDKLAQCA
ncbi:bifunctional indole-3-glycerol-phosphate synthase TrpC/phosphoribosylanthranilate isomerase TrpF [Sphingomonas sp.]|uniref:bifunctional indole-3-glycerol-phosphate synthase TrpC/phosphoribosylanthranilate isomerase TrpF n=1 Tax=Sphingomonas sp. TaxID=28214 RepID=UPI00286DDCD2|nr:bifunctional indole-3-glycerol-phosphate synthase TrpC/phosphoribosylanthranilate isomerase TrpF [Sphingomonas sp.]